MTGWMARNQKELSMCEINQNDRKESGQSLVEFAFGLVMLLFLIYEPRGLAHRWEIVKHFYRRWPFSY